MNGWLEEFHKIFGTELTIRYGFGGTWSDMVAVMLPNIISLELKLENILSMRVFEWLVITVGCKMIYA